jgi:hypothetical protein
MAGRHSASARSPWSRLLPAFLVLLASLLIAGGGFAFVGNASKDQAACERTLPVRVAAAPEIAALLGEATRDLESADTAVAGACVDYDVSAVAPERVEEIATTEPEKAPDLWVPDFSVWATRAALSGVTPATLSESLATSPVVVVGPDDDTAPSSWREVGMNTVAYLDPLTSSASTAALLSAFGEMAVTGATKTEMGAMMVPLAQRYGAQPDKPTTVEDVAAAAEEGALGVMTEQQLVRLQGSGRAQGLTGAVPQSGTMFLDHPLVALSPAEDVREAGRRLGAYLDGDHGVELRAAHGFRGPQRAPLSPDEGLGEGEVPSLPLPEAQEVAGAMRQWAVLTVPSRSLVVVDVSGSMDFTDDTGRTRISLAVDAAESALQLFPDNAQLGLWAFSVNLGGGNRDYTQLAPIRQLSDTPGGVTQREVLAEALDQLPGMTYGGTGLYDTTLAAVRTLQDDYDARAINTVILLTDGENEDPGSLTLKELVNTIERERDPARPIQVVAVGMGPDADAKALKRIAGATGGRSYVARDPADISEVFIDAMLSR